MVYLFLLLGNSPILKIHGIQLPLKDTMLRDIFCEMWVPVLMHTYIVHILMIANKNINLKDNSDKVFWASHPDNPKLKIIFLTLIIIICSVFAYVKQAAVKL